MIIINLLIITTIICFIVDLSGFIQEMEGILSKWLKFKVHIPKPFSCSLCMVWWVCLAFLLMSAKLTLPLVAFSALLSFLSIPMGQILVMLREVILHIINKLMSRL